MVHYIEWHRCVYQTIDSMSGWATSERERLQQVHLNCILIRGIIKVAICKIISLLDVVVLHCIYIMECTWNMEGTYLVHVTHELARKNI